MAAKKTSKKPERFFLSQDHSCHWYLVPATKAKAWEKWLSLDSDDERSWDAPDFARRIDGHPSGITFTDPKF
jgi:hypothetical protein